MNTVRGSLQLEYFREYNHLRPFLREFTCPRKMSLYRFNAGDGDIIRDIAPTVTKLRFRGVDHQFLEPSLREAISTFTNIIKLDMTGSTFENWTAVVRFVSNFPFLATLAMPYIATSQGGDPDDPDDPNDPNDPEISYPPPSRLIHIKLAFGCAMETVSWICQGSPIPDIQDVEAESKIDSNALSKLLRSLGGSLRHLIIHIDPRRAFLISGSRPQNLL